MVATPTFQNNAEGVTVADGTALVVGDTGGTSGDAFSTATPVGTAVFTRNSVTPLEGARSYVIDSPATTDTITINRNLTAVALACERFRGRWDTLPTGGSTVFFFTFQGSTGQCASFGCSATRQLVVQNAAGTATYTSAANVFPAAGTGWGFEAAVDNGTGTGDGRLKWRLVANDLTTVLDSGEQTAGNFNRPTGVTSRRIQKKNTGTGLITKMTFDFEAVGDEYDFLGFPAPPPVGKYDVVVGLIQSNMRGRADDFDYPTTDFYLDDVYQFNGTTIIDALEPAPTFESTPYMGPMNRFSRQYIVRSMLGPGRQVLLVNCARGGTGFAVPDSNGLDYTWDITAPVNSFNMYENAKTRIAAAMTAAGTGSKLVAMLANHGSTDGSANMPKATFKAHLQAFIPAIRGWAYTQGYTTIPAVPYIMMQMRPSLVAAENRHLIIDEAQQETANELEGVTWVASPVGASYERADSVHFNALGVRTIGTNLADALIGSVWTHLAASKVG